MEKQTKCQVRCLSTRGESRLTYSDGRLQYSYHPFASDLTNNRFMYITIMATPQVGDYYLLGEQGDFVAYHDEMSFCLNAMPVIIATTNPDLGIKARPSNSFLSKYASLNGSIKEVNVTFQNGEVKTAPDGTITVKPVKTYLEKHEINTLFQKHEAKNGYLYNLEGFAEELAKLTGHPLLLK